MKIFGKNLVKISLLSFMMASSWASAGEVAPEKQAEYAQIMQLKERLENYFYVQRPSQDEGAIYSFVDEAGFKRRIYANHRIQHKQIRAAVSNKELENKILSDHQNEYPSSIIFGDDEADVAVCTAQEQLVSKIKPLLLQDLQIARGKLLDIIAAQEQGSNHQAVAHLQEQLYEVDETNFIIKAEQTCANASNDLDRKCITVLGGIVNNYPRASIRLILAHELGHSVGLQSYGGLREGLLLSNVDKVARIEERIAKQDVGKMRDKKEETCAKIRQQQKSFEKFYPDQHPFVDVLREYNKFGINGLDYFDPTKTEAIKTHARMIFEKLRNDENNCVVYDIDDDHYYLVSSWQGEDWSRDKAFEDLFWNHLLDSYEYVDLRKKNKMDRYTIRAEEVLADHFAKLVLESEIQETADPQEKQRLALEAVLRFMISPDLATALKYQDRNERLVSQAYVNFKEAQKTNPELNCPLVYQDNDDKMEPHPTHAERLLILLTSPIIRDALKDL